MIPLDTLGNPLPPPVPSGTVARIPPSEWHEYWMRDTARAHKTEYGQKIPKGSMQLPLKSYVTGCPYEDDYEDLPSHWDFSPPSPNSMRH